MTKVYVAGHAGMVGSAIVRQLTKLNDSELLYVPRPELDLCDTAAVQSWFSDNKPDQVYLAAAKVGGIYANNSFPADFIRINLQIQSNVIQSAFNSGVKKMVFLGSSCIYPKLAVQPLEESSLLTGLLEPTNEPYAIAKIAGIKLCESFNRQYGMDYRCVMPTNLYGENDNFHPINSHVIPAMMRRFHEAKKSGARKVIVWGTGSPMREFLHVDDMASACIHLMNLPKPDFDQVISNAMVSHVNIGTGKDVTIAELANTMARVVGYEGLIEFDPTMPDGTPRKLLCVKRLNQLGWSHSIELEPGLAATYEWFVDNYKEISDS
jgi:GDP-L-fucose synthase